MWVRGNQNFGLCIQKINTTIPTTIFVHHNHGPARDGVGTFPTICVWRDPILETKGHDILAVVNDKLYKRG